MDTKLFEDYQKQLSDWQKKFFDAWIENMPSGGTSLDFKENFEKALKVQEELVQTYIETQEKTTQMMLEAQKRFWDQYFETMRKQPIATAA